MFEKNAVLEASVAAAEGVGVSLAAYDTDEARRSLDGLSGGDAGVALPSKLHGALLQLVANLELYKPYLPASVLMRGNVGGGDASTVFEQRRDSERSSSCSRCSSSEWGDSERSSSRSRSSRKSSRSRESSRSRKSSRRESPRSRKSSESTSPRSSHHGSASNTAPEVWEGRTEPHEEEVPRPAPAAKLHAEPRDVSLTLLVTNRRRFLTALAEQIVPAVAAFFRREVTLFCAEVSGRSGCVGSLSADHFAATFGAVRACAQHQGAAARVALRVAERGSSAFKAGNV
eukprot:gene17652-biopygen6403